LLDGPTIPRVKLLDFGFAKPVHLPDAKGLTAPGMMVGTPKYISPEQLLDPRRVEPSRDRWALAVVAYFALTGRHPFDGEQLPQLLQQILLCQVAPPSTLRPGLGEEVDAWFARALHREPAKRFESTRELAESFVELAPPVSVPDAAEQPGQTADEPFDDVAAPERIIETAEQELALEQD
jgi:serine/threonine-protein kinase